jgi:hypothetical protein
MNDVFFQQCRDEKSQCVIGLTFQKWVQREGCEGTAGFTQQFQYGFKRYPVIVEEAVAGVTVYSELDLGVGVSSDLPDREGQLPVFNVRMVDSISF